MMNDSCLLAVLSSGASPNFRPRATLVSKYGGDGFACDFRLASRAGRSKKYGNIGNQQSVHRRRSLATSQSPQPDVVPQQSAVVEAAPPSAGPLNGHANSGGASRGALYPTPIKDTLLALYYDRLQSVSYPSEKRRLEESKKGIDILIQKLSSNNMIKGDICPWSARLPTTTDDPLLRFQQRLPTRIGRSASARTGSNGSWSCYN